MVFIGQFKGGLGQLMALLKSSKNKDCRHRVGARMNFLTNRLIVHSAAHQLGLLLRMHRF